MAMVFISLVYNSQLGKYGRDIAISVYAVVSKNSVKSATL